MTNTKIIRSKEWPEEQINGMREGERIIWYDTKMKPVVPRLYTCRRFRGQLYPLCEYGSPHLHAIHHG